MNFEWNAEKATANLRKHGVSFDEAAGTLADPLAVTYDDPDHSTEEQRYITVGISLSGRLVVVAHTDRGKNIRIISARCATPRERRKYEEED
jgi:uncharacterized DUF497 family protein